jgi:hypothetical protein
MIGCILVMSGFPSVRQDWSAWISTISPMYSTWLPQSTEEKSLHSIATGTLFGHRSGPEFPVEGPEDCGLVPLCAGDEAAVIGLDDLFYRRDVQAEGPVLLDPLCRIPLPC